MITSAQIIQTTPTSIPRIFDQNVELHEFGAADMLRFDDLVNDIEQIFSREATVRFVPSKWLRSRTEAEAYLQLATLNATCTSDRLFFITDHSTKQVVGVIDIISPETAKRHYRMDSYMHIIEFYLSADRQSRGHMSALLPEMLNMLKLQGIIQLAAVVHRQNFKGSRLLQRNGFKYQGMFDA